ncbi:MAG TPA: glycosyltransferase family 4 protein, partial [Chitinophagaceae bacterium]|nr:glycosyltransferase family 4 protein [Chitinophagaceae bacterium]
IKASEYYLCNTAYEKNRLTALGVNQENIVITGCPVNITQYENAKGHEVRKQLNLSSNDVLIGYIGRLEATKSIPVLINAFEAAFQKNNQLHLVIAGFETAYLKQLKQIVAKLDANIQCKISFLISISENEKANLFQAIDVLVLPSTNESFGIVFLEAWACKKPVIGTAIGAVSSVISNGTDGLLMQPYNTIDLTEKILQLSNDKNLREFMGANGYNKVIQNYTWEIVTKKFRDTYVAAIEKFKKNNF